MSRIRHCGRKARPVFVTQSDSEGTSVEAGESKRLVLERAAKIGISRWVHPILSEPLSPVLLVEGKYDEAFISRAITMIDPDTKMVVRYLEQLSDDGSSGGVDALYRYIKANVNAIRMRVPNAPVIVVLDWDSESKKTGFAQLFRPEDPFRVISWPATSFNPHLGNTFRGIERHFSDRIISQADLGLSVIGHKPDGSLLVSASDYPKLKERAYSVVRAGLISDDLSFAKPFVQEVITLAHAAMA